jgi:NAD(P)-dependent dehydrogenase (short-subunit alcohol dehydrogenase family)
VAIAADVTDEAQLLRAFEVIDRELGPVAALVLCAVEAGPPGRSPCSTPPTWNAWSGPT